MKIVTTVLLAVALLLHSLDATAQPGPRAEGTRPGGSSNAGANRNTLSTGSSTNTNANSNSQFLSGSNTGVNNGALEIYAGAEPYQGFVIEGSTNLPQLPGIPSPPSNFSQPYKPDAFINTPVFLPAEMTVTEAKECRNAKWSWYGGSRDEEASSIKLLYATKPQSGPGGVTMANYVGTVMTTTSDGPFIAALCEAAYRAMRKGATIGMVEFSIRPKNTMFGLGFGASGGATGLPAAGAHPYAIAGTLGFGTGWSNQRVEGEVVLQLTALRAMAIGSVMDHTLPVESSTRSTTVPVGEAPTPAPETPVIESTSAAASPVVLSVSTSAQRVVSDPRASTLSRTTGRAQTVAYHSAKAITSIREGQSKDAVFELFGTAFITRGGRTVEVQGMRLRVSGQSKHKSRLEIGEVSLTDGSEPEIAYWFLFEDDRLVAWGRPEEWSSAATRYRVDLPYRPGLRPWRFEARADVMPGR
jgi:hypothetical protein